VIPLTSMGVQPPTVREAAVICSHAANVIPPGGDQPCPRPYDASTPHQPLAPTKALDRTSLLSRLVTIKNSEVAVDLS